eukprot:TRINITY_DN1617_c1_g1_i1.p1 TRINITY_DN1617_c1_g1~~TRINITY_DN1617_c1_g1_i1.p1  ORF type:complete len:607 (-),score=164.45 TRINITY_DN1617_c1_g1_i1:41-1594(-)
MAYLDSTASAKEFLPPAKSKVAKDMERREKRRLREAAKARAAKHKAAGKGRPTGQPAKSLAQAKTTAKASTVSKALGAARGALAAARQQRAAAKLKPKAKRTAATKQAIAKALAQVKKVSAQKARRKLVQKRKKALMRKPQATPVQPHAAAPAAAAPVAAKAAAHVAPTAASIQPHATAPAASLAAISGKPHKVTYGFYLHVFFEAAAVVHQLKQVRKFYPEAPVYVMSDGGANFSGICEKIGNCKFAWRSPAHDCWNPKPFLDRFREGAEWLNSRKAQFTIMLEPDVQLHKRAERPLKAGADAGGLYDMWNSALPQQLRDKMMELGRTYSGNKNFTLMWDRFGLAGGSIIRTKAAMIAFQPDHIDWPMMEKLWGDSVYSSDVSMLIALAAHGFNYYPWSDVFEGHDEYQTHKEGAAFEHCSKNYPGGKPYYGKELSPKDKFLVGEPPKGMMPLKGGQCQHCVWADEKECWPKGIVGNTNGKIMCPEDEKEFRKKAWPVSPPRPDLFDEKTGAFVEK